MMNAQLFALTAPLITTSSGARWARPQRGAVWLDANLVSPYDYWQYWRNTEDGDVVRFLKLFTILPLDEIARLGALKGPGHQRGQEGAGDRSDRFGAWPRRSRSGRRYLAQDFRGRRVRGALPTVEIARADLDKGLGVLTAFAEKTGLVSSNGDARRQVKAGGLKVNDATVSDEKLMLTAKTSPPTASSSCRSARRSTCC